MWQGCCGTGVNGKGSVRRGRRAGRGGEMAQTLNYPKYAISIPDKHTYLKYFSQRWGGSISEAFCQFKWGIISRQGRPVGDGNRGGHAHLNNKHKH